MNPRLVPATPHVHLPVRVAPPDNLSAARILTTRMRHALERDTSEIRLVYANWSNDQGGDLPGPDAISVSATIRLDGGAPVPLTFDGAPTVELEPGAARISDPVELETVRGAILTSTTTARGRRIPLGPRTDASAGEGVLVGPGDPAPCAAYGYGPWQILTAAPHRTLVLAVTGDSNAVGFGDSRGTADHHGWVRRALGEWPVVNLAVSGATAHGALSAESRRRRTNLLAWVRPDVAVAALGTNDLQRGGHTLREMQRALTAHWRHLGQEGMRVVAGTLPPVTTSIDGWNSLDGQTPTPGCDVRSQVNRWLRTLPHPLFGVVDLARALSAPESERIWGAGLTDDGVHPNAVGHAAVAGAAAWLVASLDDAEDGAAPLLQRYPDPAGGELR